MNRDDLSGELMDARAPEDRSEEDIAIWLLLKRANTILVEAIEVA